MPTQHHEQAPGHNRIFRPAAASVASMMSIHSLRGQSAGARDATIDVRPLARPDSTSAAPCRRRGGGKRENCRPGGPAAHFAHVHDSRSTARRHERARGGLASLRAGNPHVPDRGGHPVFPSAGARRAASEQLELWVLASDTNTLIGFMGLSGNSLEAMFLDPAHLRAGHGRRLVSHARGLKGALTVDVNEQNPPAVRFYEACGFVVVGRSELDSTGRPFPLVHMRQLS